MGRELCIVSVSEHCLDRRSPPFWDDPHPVSVPCGTCILGHVGSTGSTLRGSSRRDTEPTKGQPLRFDFSPCPFLLLCHLRTLPSKLHLTVCFQGNRAGIVLFFMQYIFFSCYLSSVYSFQASTSMLMVFDSNSIEREIDQKLKYVCYMCSQGHQIEKIRKSLFLWCPQIFSLGPRQFPPFSCLENINLISLFLGSSGRILWGSHCLQKHFYIIVQIFSLESQPQFQLCLANLPNFCSELYGEFFLLMFSTRVWEG